MSSNEALICVDCASSDPRSSTWYRFEEDNLCRACFDRRSVLQSKCNMMLQETETATCIGCGREQPKSSCWYRFGDEDLCRTCFDERSAQANNHLSSSKQRILQCIDCGGDQPKGHWYRSGRDSLCGKCYRQRVTEKRRKDGVKCVSCGNDSSQQLRHRSGEDYLCTRCYRSQKRGSRCVGCGVEGASEYNRNGRGDQFCKSCFATKEATPLQSSFHEPFIPLQQQGVSVSSPSSSSSSPPAAAAATPTMTTTTTTQSQGIRVMVSHEDRKFTMTLAAFVYLKDLTLKGLFEAISARIGVSVDDIEAIYLVNDKTRELEVMHEDGQVQQLSNDSALTLSLKK